MTFDKEYFQQIFGIIMGTNLAPFLANLYLAMLQKELKNKCIHDKNLKWLSIFQRFKDDGFGIMEGKKEDVKYLFDQFNSLRKTITVDKWYFGNHVEVMDLYIFKGEKFCASDILDSKIFHKQINRYNVGIFLIKEVMFIVSLKTTFQEKSKDIYDITRLNSRF